MEQALELAKQRRQRSVVGEVVFRVCDAVAALRSLGAGMRSVQGKESMANEPTATAARRAPTAAPESLLWGCRRRFNFLG